MCTKETWQALQSKLGQPQGDGEGREEDGLTRKGTKAGRKGESRCIEEVQTGVQADWYLEYQLLQYSVCSLRRPDLGSLSVCLSVASCEAHRWAGIWFTRTQV